MEASADFFTSAKASIPAHYVVSGMEVSADFFTSAKASIPTPFALIIPLR
jgi:hypothetical protein